MRFLPCYCCPHIHKPSVCSPYRGTRCSSDLASMARCVTRPRYSQSMWMSWAVRNPHSLGRCERVHVGHDAVPIRGAIHS